LRVSFQLEPECCMIRLQLLEGTNFALHVGDSDLGTVKVVVAVVVYAPA
jgi:hypothetical protein